MIRLVKNIFWLLLGLALGVWVMRRLNRIARSYSPSGIAGRAQGRWEGLREGLIAFGRDVRELSAAREVELRAALAGEHPPAAPAGGRHRADPAGGHHRAGPAGGGPEPLPGTDVNARPRNRHQD